MNKHCMLALMLKKTEATKILNKLKDALFMKKNVNIR